MPAGLTDILTTAQNIPVSLSNLAKAWRRGQGNVTSVVITGPTVVATSAGRLVSLSVTVAGSTTGTANNASNASNAAAGNVLCVIPNTVGILQVGMEFNAGLVISPGTGQSVVATYYIES